MQVSPSELRAYGAKAGAISAQLAATGAFDLAGNVAAMVPVFGVIGQDFLAAFGVAQASHAAEYAKVAETFGSRAALAQSSADGYEETDNQHAESIRNIIGSGSLPTVNSKEQ